MSESAALRNALIIAFTMVVSKIAEKTTVPEKEIGEMIRWTADKVEAAEPGSQWDKPCDLFFLRELAGIFEGTREKPRWTPTVIDGGGPEGSGA